jgi:hypothetical protein
MINGHILAKLTEFFFDRFFISYFCGAEQYSLPSFGHSWIEQIGNVLVNWVPLFFPST